MILSKEEKEHIKIWRLLREISVKHGEGYYSLEVTPKEMNNKYYTPTKGHQRFDSPSETIKSLENLLQMSTYEYKADIEGMVRRLAELRKKKAESVIELDELEKAYEDAISKIKKS